MIIVAGHLLVDRHARAGYLDGCRAVVEQARAAEGCLDFAISPDLLDDGRINVYERWRDADSLHAFRGSGPSDEQSGEIASADVREFDTDAGRPAGG
ncbi:putative quinol monooxygenase [Gordonia soli]|uniref:ABM domain-containing protein n=1 Tax=Gordonia soli NBRC 108243 TaxID=1223545 RepID=M0QPL3_9ACTN|nr:antibiotic biosynthesis monooxygenase [Gordonia soli]GAC70216.1 hypothetical protein GS4_33_00300 [Gordonia soli NBRC 108243]